MTIQVTPEVASAHKNLEKLYGKFENSVNELCAQSPQVVCPNEFYEHESVSIAAECVEALSKLQSASSHEGAAYERAVAEADDTLSLRKLELEEDAQEITLSHDLEVAAVEAEFDQQRHRLEEEAKARISSLDRKSDWIDKDAYFRRAKISIIPSMIVYWILGGALGFHDSGWDVFLVGIFFGLFVPYMVAGLVYLLKREAIERSQQHYTAASKAIKDETDNLIAKASAARDKKIKKLGAKRDKAYSEAMVVYDAAVASASAERAQQINTARSKKDQAMAYIETEYQKFDARLDQCLDKFRSFVDTWATENMTSVLDEVQFQNLNQNGEQVAPHLTRIGRINVCVSPKNKKATALSGQSGQNTTQTEKRNIGTFLPGSVRVSPKTPNQGEPEGTLKLTKLTQDAESGNVDAQYQLAVIYQNGQGVYSALEWYHKAADQGHADAQYQLASLSDDLLLFESMELYVKAAEQGHADAQEYLSNIDDPEAQYQLGYFYEHEKNDDYEAVEWYRKAAEQRHVGAQYNLGFMYKFGSGVEQSYDEAAEWHRKVEIQAEQGDAEAQYTLGSAFEIGHFITRYDDGKTSKRLATKWYQKAAEQGHERAKEALSALGKKR